MFQIVRKKIFNVRVGIWVAFALSSALFILFPEIDIAVSALFYDDGFYLKGSPYEVFFYKSVPVLLTLLAVGSISIFLYNRIYKREVLGLNSRKIIYIILVLALAPGLIVNATLKENWGRERPTKIQEFGGKDRFTPAFVMSNQGGDSFSSGHGSAAFSLLGFALLMRKRRELWIALTLSYGVAVSYARIIAGGHYLSDNVVSFFIVYITTHMLYYFIIEKDS